MPLATAKDVITHVPWSGDTPRFPAMVGSETLAIVESSTCMKVPAASASAVMASCPPCRHVSAGRLDPSADIARRLAEIGAVFPQDFGDQLVGDRTAVL